MYLLSDDPWPLVWVCVFVAVGCLFGLRLTGRGRYLVAAVSAVLLAGVFLLIDMVWVSDAERIEDVVHGVADAVRRSDVDTVLSFMDKDLAIEQGPDRAEVARGDAARELVRSMIGSVRFEFLRVRNLEIDAAPISRVGRADFRVTSKGKSSGVMAEIPLNESDWSLGLREQAPGVWKITRITALQLRSGASIGQVMP